MIISEEHKEYLIEKIEEAKELIKEDNVEDLLAVIEDYIVELEIESEDNDNPPKELLKLDEIYDALDSDNPSA